MRLERLLLILALLLPATAVMAQTGKIAGTVTDASTGDALPGVNVSIVGTTQGTVTDVNGYYVILNVRPGEHDVRASFIGFRPVVREGVRVNVGLTAEVDFELQEEAVGLDELVVRAERPVVQRDVSASIANIDAEQIENLPVSSVADVIGLQAGFEPGLTVRGSGGNQVQFAVDGMTYTDPRTNNPNTEIAYTSIEEVAVQTGGFNAEYGNVRSGLINVITKEPSPDEYSFDVITRYSSGSPLHFTEFGQGATDPNAGFFAYPRLNREAFPFDVDGSGTIEDGETCSVAVCGTSVLPLHMRGQYEQFEGWRSIAEGSQYSVEQYLAAQEYTYRKSYAIDAADYEFDGTITGPIPGGAALGNLRFLAAFRQTQTPYLNPGQRDAETNRTFQGKLVSNPAQGMKLAVTGIHTDTEALAMTGEGMTPTPYRNVTAELPGYTWDDRDYIEGNVSGIPTEPLVFGDWFYSPRNVTRSTYGLEFTHMLSANTFYEVQLQRTASATRTGAPDYRASDESGNPLVVRCVTAADNPEVVEAQNGQCADGQMPLTEAPFGYWERYEYGPAGVQAFGSQRGDARDTTDVTRWVARFDITSQLSRFLQAKAGVEYMTSAYDVFYGSWDPANLHQENERFAWERNPVQGALYGQTKMEFRGMVANLGLRLEYFHAAGEWYSYTPFDFLFGAAQGYDALPEADTEPIERQFSLSPRVGISFPVTDDSKFYFNYGHFRQMPDPYRLFEVMYTPYTTAIERVGNPEIALPKTVAYELGFEQSVADQFLVRLAGFYRDISNEGRDVRYTSVDDQVDYIRQEALGFNDNRGVEITLEKNRGSWVRGFINYTYLSTKGGGFGYGLIDENVQDFRQYINSPNALARNERVPEPFANINLEVRVPEDFGPSTAGINPLGNWRVALLGEWRRGAPSTWNGEQFSLRGAGQDRSISYNTRWKDYKNFDLRLTKGFDAGFGRAQFYVDVTNVFNIRQLYYRRGTIFQGDDGWDEREYMQSLHLPAPDELFEGNSQYVENPPYAYVPGNDQPGDYRAPGVAYDPIYAFSGQSAVADDQKHADALYYFTDLGEYRMYNGETFVALDSAAQDRLDQVLDDKAYINMPGMAMMGFLNPRNVYFGFRITF